MSDKAESGSALRFLLDDRISPAVDLPRVIGRANIEFLLRVDLLRQGSLVIGALSVIKLNTELLKLLYLRFEAHLLHLLIESS